MRTRLFVGAAALLGAMSFDGEALAQTETAIPTGCSDIRNDARNNPNNRPRLENLLRAANRQDCHDDIVDLINRYLQGPKDQATLTSVATVSNGATAIETPPPAAETPAPRATPAVATSRVSRTPLPIGQAVTGSLTANSPVDENSVPYQLWSFRAAGAETLQVSMTSPDRLDTYLVVGRLRDDGQVEDVAVNDDRGDGTLNSLVCFTPEAGAQYVVRARSFYREQYGSYSLLAQPISATRGEPVSRDLPVGEERTGRLGCDSAVDADNGVAYDVWTFQAEPGQAFQISMTSSALDPLISVGRVSGGQFNELGRDDDGGEGLNSLLRFIPNQPGEYVLRARTFAPEQYGNYQVLVQPIALTSLQQVRAERASAWAGSGAIAAEGDATHVDFRFDARNNRGYSVRADSEEFTPVVDIGILREGGRIEPVDFFNGAGRTSNSVRLPAGRARGQYVIRVSGPPGASGSFELFISEDR